MDMIALEIDQAKAWSGTPGAWRKQDGVSTLRQREISVGRAGNFIEYNAALLSTEAEPRWADSGSD
jgi:hypothetical protein